MFGTSSAGPRDAAPAAEATRWHKPRRGRRVWLLAGVWSIIAVAVAGCGSSSSGGNANAAAGAKLTVADVAPFTGADAALGPTYLVSCDASTNAINAAGGVLGHKLGLQGS